MMRRKSSAERPFSNAKTLDPATSTARAAQSAARIIPEARGRLHHAVLVHGPLANPPPPRPLHAAAAAAAPSEVQRHGRAGP